MPSVTRSIKARVELDGEKEYNEVLRRLNAGNSTLRSEMKILQAEYNGNTDSIGYLTDKSELLARSLENQAQKTAAAKAMQESASEYWAKSLAEVEKLKNATELNADALSKAEQKLADAEIVLAKWTTNLNLAQAAELSLKNSIEQNNRALATNKEAIDALDMANRTLATEMQKLEAEYLGSADDAEFLAKKGELLKKTLAEQERMVQTLRETVNRLTEEYGKNDAQTQEWTQKLNLAEAEHFKLKHAIEENNKAIAGESEAMTGLGDVVGSLTEKLGIKLPQGATNALNGMSKLSAGTVAAMGVAAAGVMALVKSVKSLQEETIAAAARADDILTRATQMNISAQQYQAFQYASPFVDVDVDTLAGSLSKLTQEMGKVAAGSDDAKAKFYDLGVAVYNADGTLRDAYDVWLDTMDALSGMTNETERDVAAQDLLGKSASDLASIYRDGTGALREYTAAAEENYIMSDEQLQMLGSVDDAWQKLQKDIEGNKNMIAAEWAPTAKEALEAFDRLVVAAGEALVDSGIIQGFGELVQFAIGLLDPIASLLEAADGAPDRLKPVYEILHGIAGAFAWIADVGNAAIGFLTYITPAGREKWNTALGYNAQYGEYSNLQKWNGTAATMDAQLSGYRGNGGADMSEYGYDSATGLHYDKKTGNYIFPHNAGGNDNWRGGLTWVGEAGPELAYLPRGTQIANAQDSLNAGGVQNYYINVNGVQELDEIITWFNSRRVTARMG